MSRGRGRGISKTLAIRPGRDDISTTRSPKADRLTHVVGHENNRLVAFAPYSLQVVIELIASECIKRPERLVHEKHLWVRCECACKRNALLHPARQLVDVGMLELFESNELEIVIRDLSALATFQVRPKF